MVSLAVCASLGVRAKKKRARDTLPVECVSDSLRVTPGPTNPQRSDAAGYGPACYKRACFADNLNKTALQNLWTTDCKVSHHVGCLHVDDQIDIRS